MYITTYITCTFQCTPQCMYFEMYITCTTNHVRWDVHPMYIACVQKCTICLQILVVGLEDTFALFARVREIPSVEPVINVRFRGVVFGCRGWGGIRSESCLFGWILRRRRAKCRQRCFVVVGSRSRLDPRLPLSWSLPLPFPFPFPFHLSLPT